MLNTFSEVSKYCPINRLELIAHFNSFHSTTSTANMFLTQPAPISITVNERCVDLMRADNKYRVYKIGEVQKGESIEIYDVAYSSERKTTLALIKTSNNRQGYVDFSFKGNCVQNARYPRIEDSYKRGIVMSTAPVWQRLPGEICKTKDGFTECEINPKTKWVITSKLHPGKKVTVLGSYYSSSKKRMMIQIEEESYIEANFIRIDDSSDTTIKELP
jgi:hypothetical protein